ncbi:hypothetical protein Vadar_024283 [Vaccinium darrowii]|uniref:Uncharacterized protein n=1 Tax=Vaccinium darrowii TaxID=229202 RepID=A0ACB7X3H3_9ERIC|nr:hypothetical protein Vadar_024283 [Vaccinium darrowii]
MSTIICYQYQGIVIQVREICAHGRQWRFPRWQIGVPVDCEAEVSHRFLEASHTNDLRSVLECIADPFISVNFVDAV